jgi:hypothetical protein
VVSGPFYSPAQLEMISNSWLINNKVDVAYSADRWSKRVFKDDLVDIWLISWLPEQSTELHDHGGSSGSFTVIQGSLSNTSVQAGTLVTDEIERADSFGFGPRYVHDVKNTTDVPAISVHAYSPALTSMNFYDLAQGKLIHIATIDTDGDPEL